MANGIWKDLLIEIDNSDDYEWVTFELKYNGNVIYNGRIYCEPNQSRFSIVPNQICRDYMYQQMPSIANTGWTNLAPLACYFTWKAYEPGGTVLDSGNFTLYYDWSNDFGYTAGTAPSVPINLRTDVRAPFLVTDFSGSKTIQVNDGTTTTNVTLTIATSTQGNGVYLPPLNTKWINNGSHKWVMVDGCNHRYLLYYVNSHGGWDQFLIEGYTKEKDAITSNTYAPYYANNDGRSWGTRTFQKVMTKSYKMQTGWLTDEQAGRMYHLLESPMVYMYDLVNATLVPVNITNSECEWQTYRGNGRKMAQYAIDVKVAYNTERR